MATVPFVVCFSLCLCICFIEAKRLPASLPWVVYTGVVNDLGQYLQDKIPPGHRNVVLFAREIRVDSDINFNSTYSQNPVDLQIVCDTLEINRKSDQSNYKIDLSGKDAPDLISYNSVRTRTALAGKHGCHGGSIAIYAKTKTGSGLVDVDVRGGNGGRGQTGYSGRNGAPGTFWSRDGRNGENGGAGGRGGNGGDAGEIGIVLANRRLSIVRNFLSNRVYTSGGEYGTGGKGGKAGRGGTGYTSWWSTGRSGRNGQPGTPGVSGSPGRDSLQRLYTTTNERAFYQSVPLSGSYLQRALNAEMYHITLAKQTNNAGKINEIKRNIKWIKKIAEPNGYDVVDRRCTEMLTWCDDTITPVAYNQVRIQNSAIRKHIEDMKTVGQKIYDVDSRNLHSTIQNDQLLTNHEHYARAFHHLSTQHSGFKSRYNRARQVARLLHASNNLLSETRSFLEGQFSQKLSSTIDSRANTKSFIRTALSSSDTQVSVEAPEVFEGLAIGEESGVLAGILGAEAVVAPEAVALEVVGMVVFNEVVSVLKSSFLEHDAQLDDYENYLQERAKRNAENELKRQIDQNQPNPPQIRQPYLRPRRGIRYPRLPEEQPTPQPYTETGKFIGVLDKCEPVEAAGNNNMIKATFDAITLLFTTDEEHPDIDLNRLDTIQKQELNAQLALYRIPFTILPSFIITTTVTRGDVNEQSIGKWYEFDIDFLKPSTTSYAVPITTIVLENLLHGISAVSDINIPLTIKTNSIQRLSSSLEGTVTSELGLINENQRKKRNTETMDGLKLQGENEFDFHQRSIRQAPPRRRDSFYINRVAVVKVGQGSCNVMYDQNDNARAVFDAGYGGGGRVILQAHNNLLNNIRSATVLIISHWDLDHYRYLTSYPDLINNKEVVLPTFGTNRGITVSRVVRDVQQRSTFYYAYGRDVGTVPYQLLQTPGNIRNLELRITTLPVNIRSRGQNKNNFGAITASVSDNNGNPLILLPGDASFSFIASQQKSTLKYLLATHHGSIRSITDDSNRVHSIPRALDNQGYVIYSYGQGNRYGHSAQSSWNSYSQQGWTAYFTTVDSQDGIGISLSLDRSQTPIPVLN